MSNGTKPLPENTPHLDLLKEAGLSTFYDLKEQGFVGGRKFSELEGIGEARAKSITAFLTDWLNSTTGLHAELRHGGHGMFVQPPEGDDPQEAEPAEEAAPEEPDTPQPDPQQAPEGVPERKPKADPPPTSNGTEAATQSQDSVDSINLSALGRFFQADEIEWRPDQVRNSGKGPGKALALAYVTNRAIQNRLDLVCGPTRWRNEYRPGPGGGVICGISIYLKLPDGRWEWITKWDGADNSNFSPVKGGLSDSMKRAGYQWGIGRYLYQLPTQWKRCKTYQQKGNTRFDEWIDKPELPPAFLPKSETNGRAVDHPDRRKAEKRFHATGSNFFGDEWEEKRGWVIRTYAKSQGFAAESTNDLTVQDLNTLSQRMQRKLEERQQSQQAPQGGGKPSQSQQGQGQGQAPSGPQKQQDKPQQGGWGSESFEGGMNEGNWGGEY